MSPKNKCSKPVNYWLIPSNPAFYDTENALLDNRTELWPQRCRMEPGDIVYIYFTSPVKEIRFKCVVEETNILIDPGCDERYILDEKFCSHSYPKLMEMKLLEAYDTPALCYQMLLMHGLTGAVRSQRKASAELAQYIESVTKTK